MVKHEIKVELEKSEDLLNLIQKAYFQEGLNGKILGKDHYITIEESDDINWTIFNSLNNATVKISNSNDVRKLNEKNVIEINIRIAPIILKYCGINFEFIINHFLYF